MSIICPTILAHTPDEFAGQVELLLSFANRVQIDLTDGEFAAPKTINLNQVYWPENWVVDLHVMFMKPMGWLEMLVSLSPNLVIFHTEADGDLISAVRHLAKFGIKTGIALLPETTVEDAKNLIKHVDHVLIFGGSLGQQGGMADLVQLDKVEQIREINPDAEIGWDGGASIENVSRIATAGVDVISVGSVIQAAKKPAAIYAELSRLAR